MTARKRPTPRPELPPPPEVLSPDERASDEEVNETLGRAQLGAQTLNFKKLVEDAMNASNQLLQQHSTDVGAAATHVVNVQQVALKTLSDAQAQSALLMTNAIESANLAGKNAVFNSDSLDKQHLAHRDISTDRTWNIDEVGRLIAEMERVGVPKDAIAAALAAALAEALTAKKEG